MGVEPHPPPPSPGLDIASGDHTNMAHAIYLKRTVGFDLDVVAGEAERVALDEIGIWAGYELRQSVGNLVMVQRNVDPKFVDALEAASEWIGVLRASTGDVVMSLFDERDPRALEERTYKLIAEALALSTRKGSATGTTGIIPASREALEKERGDG